jgi:DNA-3-methyladenine glycosylase
MFITDFTKALKPDFYLRDTRTIALELLGKVMVKIDGKDILAGRIVETEAYLPGIDLSSHAFNGRTKRNLPMFENGGILYVYKSYGIHNGINIVT